jgi:3-phosphoshikimate 1-carboxyvinyltransferase
MSVVTIRSHSGNCKAEISLPASKSISNRLMLIKALCHEDLEIENLSTSDDTRILTQCLEDIYSEEVFDVGDAGTAFRFLTAMFAITPGTRTLTGSKQMMKRPVGDLVKALKALGADITYTDNKNHPPLIIKGRELTKRKSDIRASISSQYISALLLIAPRLPQGLELKMAGNVASKPYITMTLKMMEHFGIRYRWKWKTITIEKQLYRPKSLWWNPTGPLLHSGMRSSPFQEMQRLS